MRPWKWALATLGAFLSLVFLVVLVSPSLQYVFIPITGEITAPEIPVPEVEVVETVERVFASTPGEILANAEGIVTSIEDVPENGGWINTAPLDIEQLQAEGKYILFDFWTYSCVNCVRASPYGEDLWQRYKEHGLIMIGVHAPEFGFERDPKNVLFGVKQLGITYPVLLDADMIIWRAFDNHYWPGKYLMSPEGKIVWTHFGEGAYQEEDDLIQELLGAPEYGPVGRHLQLAGKRQTPELYAGTKFMREGFGNSEQPRPGTITSYTIPRRVLEEDVIYLSGDWYSEADFSKSEKEGTVLLKYRASDVYVVLSADKPSTVKVVIDGEVAPDTMWGADVENIDGYSSLMVSQPKMYHVVSKKYGRNKLELIVPPGVELYAFTFGSY